MQSKRHATFPVAAQPNAPQNPPILAADDLRQRLDATNGKN
jgi:hypothetical protein